MSAIDELVRRKNELLARIDALTAEKAALKSAVALSTETMSEMRGEIERQTAENKRLTEALRDLQERTCPYADCGLRAPTNRMFTTGASGNTPLEGRMAR